MLRNDCPTRGTDVKAEWILFGEPSGEYILLCANDYRSIVGRYARHTGDGSRIIRTAGGIHHKHSDRGACIPLVVPYGKTRAARDVRSLISRSLLAGYPVIML